MNGFVYAADAFKTSTHEKTSMIYGVSGTGGYKVDKDTSYEQTMIPVGDAQLVVSGNEVLWCMRIKVQL